MPFILLVVLLLSSFF